MRQSRGRSLSKIIIASSLFALLLAAPIHVIFATTYDSTITISPSDTGALTWFRFDELGDVNDSTGDCGVESPCFSFQLNTDTSTTSGANFYQALMYVYPDHVYWNWAIGCDPTCSYEGSGSSNFNPSLLNNSENVFIMAINDGSSSIGWGATSCDTSIDEAAYSFQFLVVNLSSCGTSDGWSGNPGSSEMAAGAPQLYSERPGFSVLRRQFNLSWNAGQWRAIQRKPWNLR